MTCAFFRLLGLTLVAVAVQDIGSGIWHVHTGELYDWAHFPIVPLYGTGLLMLEWAALLFAGGSLLLDVARRPAVWLGLLAMLAGLSQRYANQRCLIIIVLFYVALNVKQLHFTLLRSQIIIVYGFTVLHKLTSQFWNGETLVALGFDSAWASWLSLATLVAEVAIPLLLWRAPWLGVWAVVLLHGGLAFTMPGIAPFSLIMVAMATTFLPERTLLGVAVGSAPEAVRHLLTGVKRRLTPRDCL